MHDDDVPIPLTEARRLAEEHGAEAVVIWYALPDGRMGWASWGTTQRRCRALKKMRHDIADEIGQRYVEELDCMP